MTADPGLIAGRFRVGGLLGSGGTASVFRARDDVTGRTVAIKLLHPHLSRSAAVREAFLLEARRTAHVSHPGIVTVIDVGTFDGDGTPIAWIAQQLAEGTTLAEHVRSAGPLSVAQAAALACDVLDALAATHAATLVHRDVSPSNVMVRIDDTGVHAMLLDFGLADVDGQTAHGDDVVRSSVTAETAGVVGNVEFASPEQLSGRPVGPAGDLYQAGGLLYFALTGRAPFAGQDRAALIRSHLHAPPPVPSVAVRGIPAAIDRIVVRALVKNPSDRFADAAQMRDAIQAALASPPRHEASGPTRVIGVVVAAPTAASVGRASRSTNPPVAERSGPGWGTVVTIIAVLAAVAAAVPLVTSAGRSVPLPRTEQVVSSSPTVSATRDRDPDPDPDPTVVSATSVVPALGTLAETRAALAAVGLDVGDVVERDGPQPAGAVLSADPPPGTTVPRGSMVGLFVASGTNVIPDVTGMDAAAASSTLRAAGFAPTVSTVPADRPAGTVTRLEPAAGSLLPLGSVVAVFVATARPTATTGPPTASPTPVPTPSPTPSPTAAPR